MPYTIHCEVRETHQVSEAQDFRDASIIAHKYSLIDMQQLIFIFDEERKEVGIYHKGVLFVRANPNVESET
jgi:hypothetical protein